MGGAEFPLSHFVAVPLVDEFAVLVEMDDSRGADVVRRIIRVGVVRALVRVAPADVHVAVRCEGDHHRLPEKTLSLGFVPIPSAPAFADRHEQLAVPTEFHHGRAIRGGDPDVVLRVDGHAVRFVLVANHIGADLEDQFVIRIELEELRLSGVRTLKDPQVSFRIERDRGHAAEPGRQHVRVCERVTDRLLPLHARQRLARAAKPVAAQRRATAGRRLADTGHGSGGAAASGTRRNSDVALAIDDRSSRGIGERRLEKPRRRSVDGRSLRRRMGLRAESDRGDRNKSQSIHVPLRERESLAQSESVRAAGPAAAWDRALADDRVVVGQLLAAAYVPRGADPDRLVDDLEPAVRRAGVIDEPGDVAADCRVAAPGAIDAKDPDAALLPVALFARFTRLVIADQLTGVVDDAGVLRDRLRGEHAVSVHR